MRKTASLFLVLLFGASGVSAMAASLQGQSDEFWIDQLRQTPMNQLEAGLSQMTFADWFADSVKPTQMVYEVKECSGVIPTDATGNDRLLCVVAWTKPLHPGWRRAIRLTFVVGTFSSSKEGKAELKPLPCRFADGWLNPANPKVKAPMHKILKLSELGRPRLAPAARPNS